MYRLKSFLCLICMSMCLLLMFGMAHAVLTTIGTATYNGSEYNLIWDDNNNGNSVVWLDYSNARINWYSQVKWVSSLNGTGVLAINLYDGYTVDWGSSSWRLPTTNVDGGWKFGYDGTTTKGYNITSSEIGHLFFDELGNLASYDTSGNRRYAGDGLTETGDFENLIECWYSFYWSGTDNSPLYTFSAWYFDMNGGYQNDKNKTYDGPALAVRTGEVSAAPVPGAILLLGSGLLLTVIILYWAQMRPTLLTVPHKIF